MANAVNNTYVIMMVDKKLWLVLMLKLWLKVVNAMKDVINRDHGS